MTILSIWTALGPFVGGIIALWGFLKLSPATFIERGFGHYLDRRMAAIKQDHDRQIETLKSDLSHLADRGVRSNEREYEALTAAWGKFMDAFYATRRTVGDMVSVPDFARMNDDQIKAFLATVDAGTMWTEEIMNATDRHKSYMRMHRMRVINEAGAAIGTARDTVRRQSVFIPASIEEQFELAIAQLQQAQSENKTQFEIGGMLEFKASMALIGQEGELMFAGIRDTVRVRLHRTGPDQITTA